MKIGTNTTFITHEIPVYCEKRTIHLELPTNHPMEKVYGQRINVTISGVRDAMGGNVAEASTTWAFLGNRPNLDKASAVIEGLKLRMAWNASMANAGAPGTISLRNAVKDEFKTFTKVRCALPVV